MQGPNKIAEGGAYTATAFGGVVVLHRVMTADVTARQLGVDGIDPYVEGLGAVLVDEVERGNAFAP